MHKLKEWFGDERGRVQLLADYLEITPAAVSQWQEVPPFQVLKVAHFTGLTVDELRADMLPKEHVA